MQWKAAIGEDTPVRSGGHAIIDLSAKVDAGWHVYALTQPTGGPIPLKVSIDANNIATLHGKASGTEPIRQQDPSFQLETQTYRGDFVLHLPIEVKLQVPGEQGISLNVRFQACSDRTCLPPRTVHLAVPIKIVSGSYSAR